MPLPLEASPIVQINFNEYVILGGKSQKGYESSVFSINFGNNDFIKKIGNLREAKCLHKTMYLGNKDILIFGGEQYPVEVFNYGSGQVNTN